MRGKGGFAPRWSANALSRTHPVGMHDDLVNALRWRRCHGATGIELQSATGPGRIA
jgi:hypothetical protein